MSQSYPNFEAASRDVLRLLHARLGFNLWMVTRTEGSDWIVLQAEDHGYGVSEGSVFNWADSFCSRMVVGEGPSVAPRASEVPAYAAAPIGNQVDIGAYIGVPLHRGDGSLFGTLCAIDPTPQPEVISAELPLIEVLARLLGTILKADLDAEQQARRAERAEADSMLDSLTGLYNRRGWDQLMAAEDSRCRRYGHPACVLFIDLDGLKLVNDTEGHRKGDELLRGAGQALRIAVREQDVLARVGGDEFCVLGVESDAAGAEQLRARVSASLQAAGVGASLGMALRHPERSLACAEREADEAMYARKRERQAS